METGDISAVSRGGAERRRAPRQKFVTKGLLYRDDRAAAPQRILIKDVSMLGVGFESQSPVEPGTRCRIRIEAGPTQISWRLQVVCCGKIQDGPYRMGGQFVPAELERAGIEPPASIAAVEPDSVPQLYIVAEPVPCEEPAAVMEPVPPAMTEPAIEAVAQTAEVTHSESTVDERAVGVSPAVPAPATIEKQDKPQMKPRPEKFSSRCMAI